MVSVSLFDFNDNDEQSSLDLFTFLLGVLKSVSLNVQ